MCYKNELQKKNEEKLRKRFAQDNINPQIQKYFLDIESKRGAISYWIAIKDLIVWLIDRGVIAKTSLADVTLNDFYDVESMDVNAYLHGKEDSGMSPTTLQTRKMIFSSFWEYLVETNKCPVTHNIINKVKYKGFVMDHLVRKCPTDEQIKNMEEKILKKKDVFLRTRNYCILKLFEGSGIRMGELCGLDIKDLYLDKEVPYIKVIGKGTYREIEARSVYLSGSAVSALNDWLKVREDYLLEKESEADCLFFSKNLKRMVENDISKMISNYSSGEVSPHMIRHWYATKMSSKSPILTQQNLGHKSFNTTYAKYVNGIDGMKDILASM